MPSISVQPDPSTLLQPEPTTLTTIQPTSSTSVQPAPPASSTKIPLAEVFNSPTIYKSVSHKKSKRTTCVRSLTSVEIIKQFIQKSNGERTKSIRQGYYIQSQRELKRTKKWTKVQGKSKTNKQMKLNHKSPQESSNKTEDYWRFCKGNYFDDASDDEDWIRFGCNCWYQTGLLVKDCPGFSVLNISWSKVIRSIITRDH